MSSSPTSNAGASTLTRPRVAIAIVTTLSAAALAYYTYLQAESDPAASLPPGPGLHRSNAVRGDRRRQHHEDDAELESPNGGALATAADENIDLNNHSSLRETTELADDENNDDWYADEGREPRQRSGENIVTLLFRVSEDNARRNAYVHRGCQCNGCGMVPIRGIRYRCANCADFDLCEACESQSLHNKTHVFYKVKVPAPPFGPRQIQPVWYPGDPDTAIRQLPRFLLGKWSAETGFERVELDALWEQWTFMANNEWRDDPNGLCLAMDRKTFERCLVPSGGYRHATPNLIHDRMFAFYDTNNDDLIGFEEFLHGVSYRKRKDKLRRTFDGYDIDCDGFVDRRDFLRMFRAYYVLYKQMHRDILEGLDDHMMTTIEAQQLITSRQPLSSLFGREGRVPPADHSRPMNGKTSSHGEVYLRDDKGAVHEDTPDVSSRQEILSRLFTRHGNQGLFTESFGSSSRRPASLNGDSQYWSGIVNPPQNLVDLSSLISGDYPQLDAILDSVRQEHQDLVDQAHRESYSSEDDEDHTSEEQQGNGETRIATNGAGNYDENATSQARPIPDASRFTNTLPTESQLRAQHQAISDRSSQIRSAQIRRQRTQARKALMDRWRRRHFYLDEEEGATPPAGWTPNEDLFAEFNFDNERSQGQQAGPSRWAGQAASGYVPESFTAVDGEVKSPDLFKRKSQNRTRSGIPVAERDAGKEILYQVTQQAFNELLDELFKRKEDIAVRAAETREQRIKYRAQLAKVDLNDENQQQSAPKTRSPSRSRPRQPLSNKPIPEQSLEELLQTSGYTVIDSADEEPEEERTEAQQQVQNNEVALTPLAVAENESRAAENATAPIAELEFSYDPTMPQFRPNSVTDVIGAEQSPVSGSRTPASTSPPIPLRRSSKMLLIEAKDEKRSATHPESIQDAQIDHNTLVAWKRLDLAEEEARERGGWGRLSYEEFEDIYREHEFADGGRNRLDYLGSWIDFCIP